MKILSSTERWADIPGYEGRYQISDHGRVKSLSFMQRYLTRKEKIRKPKSINSGYLAVTLCLDCAEESYLIHRLVARAFVAGEDETVNHIDGNKRNNRWTNLEWVSYTDNHLHAVELGLNSQAIRVKHPETGTVYSSITRAEKHSKVHHRTISAEWERV